jgi:hypothetical protein
MTPQIYGHNTMLLLRGCVKIAYHDDAMVLAISPLEESCGSRQALCHLPLPSVMSAKKQAKRK